jgi:flagellar basal-body rod protein FlgC
MAFMDSLNISGSGLTAQKYRMEIVAQNLANAETTRTAAGGPYRRKLVVLEDITGTPGTFADALNNASGASSGGGVRVKQVLDDTDDFKVEYDPTHPDADQDGYVRLPNVDTTEEMVDMMSASRLYEANITAFNALKEMASKALEIGK